MTLPKPESADAKTLLRVMANRRTRRFAKSATMPSAGPLQYQGKESVEPLTEYQEAALAFAAVGITGAALAELPYNEGEKGGGNVITSLVGRTIFSPDAAHATSVIVINDAGTTFLQRPQNFDAEAISRLIELAQTQDVTSIYKQLGCKLPRTERPTLDAETPYSTPFNVWASNIKGTTFFLPVLELTEIYLSALFAGLNKNSGYYIVDDRKGLQAAGLRPFAASEGGYLDDDVKNRRIFPLDYLDTLASMLASVELGALLQNMSLMAHSLGLGGWPHFAGNTTQWLEKVGFAGEEIKLSKLLSLSPEQATALRVMDADQRIWSPWGLPGVKTPDPAKPEDWLLRSFCPPFYPDMRAAVDAFVEKKFGGAGRLRDGGGPSAWKQEHSKGIKENIPKYDADQIDAAKEHAEYVYDNYGRFPAKFGPFVTLTAFQAHQLETGFYGKYYEP